jgi:hypothetical protein
VDLPASAAGQEQLFMVPASVHLMFYEAEEKNGIEIYLGKL